LVKELRLLCREYEAFSRKSESADARHYAPKKPEGAFLELGQV